MTLQSDEFYFMFVKELAGELRGEAWRSFADAGCDESKREHFMNDLIDAMRADQRWIKK